MPFYKISEIEDKHLNVGPAVVKAVAGDLMKVGIVTYLKGEGAIPHFHPNEEQFVLMLEGRRYVILGDEERIVGPGDLIHIPRNTRHGGRTIGDKAVFFAAKSPCGDGDLSQDYNKANDAEEVIQYLEQKLVDNSNKKE